MNLATKAAIAATAAVGVLAGGATAATATTTTPQLYDVIGQNRVTHVPFWVGGPYTLTNATLVVRGRTMQCIRTSLPRRCPNSWFAVPVK